MEDRHPYYRALTRNMILIIVLVSFTPLLLISGLIGYSFETAYREKVVAHLKELVRKHQQNIDGFLDEKMSYIRVLADSYTFEELSDEAFLTKKLAVLQQAYDGVFVDLGVVDDRGVQIAYTGNFKLANADYSGAEWFRTARTREHFISDVFLGLRRQPHFIITVKRNTGGREWLLRATIDFMAFNSLVGSIRMGETGGAFIINRNGEFQTDPRIDPAPNKDYFLKLFEDGRLEGFPSSRPGGVDKAAFPSRTRARNVLAGNFDHQGRNCVYVATPLKDGEWLFAYEQDTREAFPELYRSRRIAIAIFLLGGLAIVFVAVLLSRRMVQHIREADREKESMTEKMVEAGRLASVGELAAGIAHEINNPVAIMVEEAGWIEDLLDDEEFRSSENLDEFKRALQQINNQGVRCKEITHKLLSFARRTDPKPEEFQLNHLLEELVGISEQRSKTRNVKVEKNLAPDLPPICASPSEMQQVFLNLLNNAFDAMPSSGGTIEVTSRLDGEAIVVDVVDNGHGMPKAILPKIFDPFFTTKPVGKGTGLGLSICYGLVEKLGGKITVNSALGMGTTFHVHIPVCQRQESLSPSSSTTSNNGRSGGDAVTRGDVGRR